jgi:hypothetical protein
MIAESADRVPSQTGEEINRRIRVATERRLAYYRAHPEEIPLRLAELDREWDVERTLEANAASLAFAGVALGVVSDRRWFALSAAVTGFLLQHALQGWCPPLPVLRRLGFRTAREIEQERYALKALAGDFDAAGGRLTLEKVLRAVGLSRSPGPA